VQGGEAGAGTAAEIENALRLDAHVVQPGQHAARDLALQHGHFIVAGRGAGKTASHLALINELRRCLHE
jgi:hypothetical protein